MQELRGLGGKRVGVSGGAGFIGSHLVEALVASGARVRVVDDLSTGARDNLDSVRQAIEFVIGDIRDPAMCRFLCEGAEVVFHQAAVGSVPRSMDVPDETLDVNVAGTARVFAAARDAGAKRVVYASSSAVYGDSALSPRREGEEGAPLSPYALSKRMDEELAEVFARCFGMTLVGLRYFNVYGPRQRADGPYAAVIPRFIAALEQHQVPVLYGDGRQSRDFTYVEDVVSANLQAALAPVHGSTAVNVGGGAAVSIEVLARLVGAAMGRPASPRRESARPGDVLHSRADTARACEVLGFRPRVGLEEGLARTLAARRVSAGNGHGRTAQLDRSS